jgi:hypothetical protein
MEVISMTNYNNLDINLIQQKDYALKKIIKINENLIELDDTNSIEKIYQGNFETILIRIKKLIGQLYDNSKRIDQEIAYLECLIDQLKKLRKQINIDIDDDLINSLNENTNHLEYLNNHSIKTKNLINELSLEKDNIETIISNSDTFDKKNKESDIKFLNGNFYLNSNHNNIEINNSKQFDLKTFRSFKMSKLFKIAKVENFLLDKKKKFNIKLTDFQDKYNIIEEEYENIKLYNPILPEILTDELLENNIKFLTENLKPINLKKIKDDESRNLIKNLIIIILNYYKDNLPITSKFSNIPVFVPVVSIKNKKEIVTSYTKKTYPSLNKYLFKRTKLTKNYVDQQIKNFFYTYNVLPLTRRNRTYELIRVPRRRRLDLFKTEHHYKFNVIKQFFYKRPISEKQKEKDKIAISLAFIGVNDANFYKQELIRKSKPTVFIPRDKVFRKKLIAKLKKSVEIKQTSILNIVNSFKNLDKKNDFKNTLIIIPEFLKYNKLKNNKLKVLENFPKKMLSKTGFLGTPICKTKILNLKNIIKTEQKNKHLNIPLKYYSSKFRLVSLDKINYELEAKQNINSFYEKEKNFIDNVTNTVEEEKELFLIEIYKIINKIKNKCKTITKLNLVYKFLLDNYNEAYLLEKTSHFIDKINKNIK